MLACRAWPIQLMIRGRIASKPIRPAANCPLHPAHPTAEPSDVLLGQQPVRREDPVAEEADALVAREDDALVPVDPEPERSRNSLDLGPDLVEPPLVVGEDQEVIDVTDVAQPEPVGDEVVERVEVDVGEELAGLVAQRQAPAPLGGREQVVAGEPHQHRVLGIAVVDDPVHQPEDVRVLDLAGDQALEDRVVDRREELADIGLQDVAVTAGELPGSGPRRRGSPCPCGRRSCRR